MHDRPAKKSALAALFWIALSAAAPVSARAQTLPTPQLQDVQLSADVLLAVGGSTEDDASLETLQGRGHDPNQRGFTFQQLELSVSGAVDPYFRGEAHVLFLTDDVELEEAFAHTLSLPQGLQLEAGYFLTEFGIINPRHPHAWEWQDQPVINTRLFSGDGLRAPGARVGWLLPLPWFSEFHLGVQNANDDTAVSFLGEGHTHGAEEEEHAEEEHSHHDFEETVGGRPAVGREVDGLDDLLYLIRWVNSWDLTGTTTSVFGLSGLMGPNDTGDDGRTFIYGADLMVKWRPATTYRGWPFLKWQSEVLYRDFLADDFSDDSDPDDPVDLDDGVLYDWGLYTQLLYGFHTGWVAGIRYEYATGGGPSLDDEAEDPLRDERHRVSPLLAWHPTEFSRLRLQYDYDHAEHLEDDAHSIWLGLEIGFGAHPAHAY